MRLDFSGAPEIAAPPHEVWKRLLDHEFVASVPTLVNAVCDALAPLGVSHIDKPLTPARVWAAIQQARAGGGGGGGGGAK